MVIENQIICDSFIGLGDSSSFILRKNTLCQKFKKFSADFHCIWVELSCLMVLQSLISTSDKWEHKLIGNIKDCFCISLHHKHLWSDFMC